ncbi:MAG TPA: DMT family transporter [Syntrophomonadaceae bacterium]|nr:DMT family transporter [Syntrophomonadaceae bacterium]
MLQRIPDQIKGIIYVLASALMYASLPILAKISYSSGLQPIQTLVLRYLFASLVLLPCLILFKKSELLIPTPLILIQGFLLVVGSLLYFLALRYLPAGLLSVLFFTYPIWVAVLDILIYKNKPNRTLLYSTILAVSGIVLIFGWPGSYGSFPIHGIILAFFSSFCYALFCLAGQKNVSQRSPLSLTFLFSLTGVLVLTLLMGKDVSSIIHLTVKQGLIVFGMALFNTILAVTLFLKGVRKIGAAWASLISIAEPVMTLIMAFFILGETLLHRELLGSSLVVLSLLLAITPRNNQSNLRSP